VLGPTLFLICINNLFETLKYVTPILYADVTNLFLKSKNLNNEYEKISSDLKRLYEWCQINKLTINYEKTSHIIFKNYQNKFQFDLKLTIKDKPITAVDKVKFLGVIIDRNLNWSSHIQKILLNLRPISGLFYRLNVFAPKKC